MSDACVFVTIKTGGVIPFLNRRGPISRPISISYNHYEILKGLGYEIVLHEKQNVVTNRETGERKVVTLDNFEPHQEGDFIDVDTTEPSAALTPPEMNTVIPEVPTQLDDVEEPEEDAVADSEEGAGTAEDPPEDSGEGTEEETADGEELDVYDMEVYKSWTKAQLSTYLRKAEEHLTPETVQELATANKTRLLEIVEKEIVEVAQ